MQQSNLEEALREAYLRGGVKAVALLIQKRLKMQQLGELEDKQPSKSSSLE